MSKLFSTPSNFPFITHQEDSQVTVVNDSGGGRVLRATAHEALNIGDVVYWTPAMRVGKSLESALYTGRYAGVIVGTSKTGYFATNSSTLVGSAAAAAGEDVLVQVTGACYVAADATTTIRAGDAITAGRTTAGRVRPDQLISGAVTSPGLVIKAGGGVLVKAANATQTIVSGVQGTATAANLDMAALSGTVNNATFNVFVFRVAADGTTVTSAMGTAAATLAGVLWPTGVPTVATLGFVIINPTGTGNFVGNTTALDDATVVPNAKYVDIVLSRRRIGMALAAYTTPTAGDPILILLD